MQATPYLAPNFILKDSSGQVKTLDDYAGKWLVLYFYPKDDTPGCTIEACSIRDAHEKLIMAGAQVVGISMDDSESHEKFKSKYALGFTLLSDPDRQVINAYGAWGKKMFGKEGVLRKTFLIDPTGNVTKIWGRVTPEGHGDQVLAELHDQMKARNATNAAG